MNTEDRDDLLARLIEEPRERERLLRNAELSNQERQDNIEGLLATADAVWLSAHGAPNLEDDPVAAMLGLVPDAECRLESKALSRARKRARMKVGDVANRLRQRGWDVQGSDVFRWETRAAQDVPPALVQSLAEILETSVDALVAAPSSTTGSVQLAAVKGSALFDQLVDRWARVQRVSRAVATASLESRMLATVHRGEHPDEEQLLHSLEALVASVEEATGE